MRMDEEQASNNIEDRRGMPVGAPEVDARPQPAELTAEALTWIHVESPTSGEAQQLNIDVGAMRSAHPGVKDRADRPKLADIKTLKEDAAAVEKQGEEIRQRYSRLFKV